MATKKQAKKKTGKKAPAKKAPARKAVVPQPKAAKPLSGLAAAVKVLAEAKEPLGAAEIVKRMLTKGYWKTKGKTPVATVYSAIFREIKTRGADSRFKKTGPGKFAPAK
jgi:hypothetical protein